MIYEYAISPGLFNSEDRVVISGLTLGMNHGRLISDYPKKKWEQLALATIKKFSSGDMQARAWKECVFNFRKQGSLVSRPSSGFNVDKTWLENALEEHARSPFRAIVDSTDDNDSPAVVPVGVRMLTSPLWQASGNDRLERKASSMVERIQPLLNIAKTIVLVDRHFYIDGHAVIDFTKSGNLFPCAGLPDFQDHCSAPR